MQQFDVKVLSNGPIITVHVIDDKGNLEIGINESLELAISQAVSKTLTRKLLNHPAIELLEEFVKTADSDILFDKAEKLLDKFD